jgi:hypothetical protein
MGEPEWSKAIPSESICTFYFTISVIIAVLGGLSALFSLGVLFKSSKLGLVGMLMFLQSTLVTAFMFIFYYFLYVLCDRSLLTKPAKQASTLQA